MDIEKLEMSNKVDEFISTLLDTKYIKDIIDTYVLDDRKNAFCKVEGMIDVRLKAENLPTLKETGHNESYEVLSTLNKCDEVAIRICLECNEIVSLITVFGTVLQEFGNDLNENFPNQAYTYIEKIKKMLSSAEHT